MQSHQPVIATTLESLLAHNSPLGVIKTTTYTNNQLTTIAIELPMLRMRDELISEGYKNGMQRNDTPWNVSYQSQGSEHGRTDLRRRDDNQR